MRPLKIFAILVCLVPAVAYSQIVDPSFNSPLPFTTPSVNVIKVMPDGKIMLGGAFDMYGDQVRQSLIRLHPDGTLDTSFVYPFGKYRSTYQSIEVKEGGQTVVHDSYIVRTLAENGSVVNTFESNDFTEFIQAIRVLPDGKTLVAGFGFLNGYFFRRHNTDGTIDHSFAFPFQVGIAQITLTGERIIISDGWGMIMALRMDGEPDYTFELGPFGNYYSLDGIAVQPDGKILRYFSQPSYQSNNRVFMVRHNGSAETEQVIEGIKHSVVGVLFWNDKIYVQQITGPNISPKLETTISRLNIDGTIDPTFNPINAFYQSGPKGFDVGEDGSVTVVNSDSEDNRSGVIRYDANGNVITAFNPDLRRYGYYKVVRQQTDGKLIIAGNFYGIGDHFTNHIARLLPNGSPDRTFAVTVNYGEGLTAELAGNGSVLVSAFNEIFKVNATGALDQNFKIERTDDLTQVTKMQVLADGKIVMLGYNNIYRLLPDGRLDPAFACGTCSGGDNGGLPDFIVQPDGKIIYASISNDWNGEPVKTLIRINTDGTLDRTFPIGTGPDASAFLTQILPGDSGFLLRGYMESFNGRPILNGVVKLNSDGTFDEPFMTNYEMIQPREIYHFRQDVSGYFRTILDFQDISYLFTIDRIAQDGTLDNSFKIPSDFTVSFNEDIISDNNAIWIVGENSYKGEAVFITKFLRSNISITGTTLPSVAEDTPFELLPEHIIIEGMDDANASEFQLQISSSENYSVSGNTITPTSDFNGVIIVPITVLKNSHPLVSGEISINIAPVNDKPVITAANVQIHEDVVTAISLDQITFTDVDSDYSAIHVHLQQGVNFTVNGNSILGNANYYGPIEITLTLNDGIEASESFTFTAQILPVNDPPVITAAAKNQKCSQSSPLDLTVDNFQILDIDDTDGFTVQAVPGDGYEIVDAAVVPQSKNQGRLLVSVVASDGDTVGNVFSFEVHVLPSKSNNNAQNIWPNPASQMLYHNFENAQVCVRDLSGLIVASDVTVTGSIDIRDLRSGFYMVEVKRDGKKETFRFLKE